MPRSFGAAGIAAPIDRVSRRRQTKILAVGFADRKRVAKIDGKRLGRCLVENRDGTIVGAEKAAAADRENTHLGFFLRLNAENVEVEKTCA